ncbi:MAG TPA: PAS domain S-box protein [Prolixibacteraceae bacterium]|nr:PAS domain S-box protein [Prolixibacteraceae bacterium]
MHQIIEFFSKLFQTENWPARWEWGTWTEFHGWLYILSDLGIWAAFFVFPFLLIRFIRKNPTSPLPLVFWTFVAFIIFCGLTYFIDILVFWWPGYRLSALLRFVTAVISWITIIKFYKYIPTALTLRSAREVEEEMLQHKRTEARFMGLLESAPDAMVITNIEGKITMVNAQTETIFGYNRAEILGQEVEILIPQRFHHRHVHHRNDYINHPKVRAMGHGMELYGRRKDGTEFPVEVSLSPMNLIDDNELVVMSAIRDITRQKETESEIKKLNENLELLVIERTSELELALMKEKIARSEMAKNQQHLALLTDATQILSSSLDYKKTLNDLAQLLVPRFADWCSFDEFDEHGIMKRIVVNHVDPEKINLVYQLSQVYPADANTREGGYGTLSTRQPRMISEINDEVIRSLSRNEDHYRLLKLLSAQSAILVPLLIRDKIFGIMSLVSSDSNRKFNEEDYIFAIELARRITLAVENTMIYRELQESNADLEDRVAKRTLELEAINKELEAFSYSVSHDLRAPLRSIDGFSNKILKDYGTLFDEQGKDYFNRVMNASRHMGHLIDDLLKLARISRMELHPEAIDLSEIARNIVAELQETSPERKAEFLIDENLMAKGDRSLIQVVLQNLLDNAWKYSRNSSITRIEFGSLMQDNRTVYFIRDNGVGFDMKYVDKLFGAFQRLHSVAEFEGTGIGLATVNRIIRRHHGTIWAESEINKGTTFFFTL